MVPPPTSRNLARLAKHHFGKIRLASFVVWLSPALWLATEWWNGALGINPLNRLLHVTGSWAMIMLLVTLGVTPARRLSVVASQLLHAHYGKRVSDWNWLIRLRRQMGLFGFFYGCLHLSIYLAFDVGLQVEAVREDVFERPFIFVGFLAFTMLIPLAVTSNQASMRRMGRSWRRLHLLSYPIALLAITHFWLLVKPGNHEPLLYSIALALLIVARVAAWRRGDRSAGIEVNERG